MQTEGPTFTHGTPVRVLDTAYAGPTENSRPYDVSPDGERFLMIKEATTEGDATGPRLAVVLNWYEELKQRVPMP